MSDAEAMTTGSLPPAEKARANEVKRRNYADERRAVAEMKRVLQPGGRLILVDHIRSSVKPILWLQRVFEFIPSRTKGEYTTRRPALHVMAAGFDIQPRDRLRAGIIERLAARKQPEP